jgi:hypothetical protein
MTTLLPPELIDNLLASDSGNDSTVAGAKVSDALNTLKAYDATLVVGPASATDNRVARFDGVTGKLIQDSSVTLDDSGNFTGILALTATGTLTGAKLTATNLGAGVQVLDLETTLAAVGAYASIDLAGKDDATNYTTYAKVLASILDPTDGTEDGSIALQTMVAGTLGTAVTFAQGQYMPGATGGDQGPGTINAFGLYVNGVPVGPPGTGDVVGPASATDNAITRYNGTTGKSIQGSIVIIDDLGNITGVNDLTVTGNLAVNGTLTTVNTTNLQVEDSLIQLAKNNNATDTLDIGFVGLYDTTGSQDLYAGIFRDATDGKFKAFVGSQEDLALANSVNISATGYTVATLVANIEGNVTGNLTGTASGNVANTLYDAFTIVYADTDNTPAALTVGASTFVGRKAAGGISAMSTTEARTLLNVSNGANASANFLQVYAGGGVDFTAGSSTTLTLPATPTNEASLSVFFNGLFQQSDEWSFSGTTLTFGTAIPVGVTSIEVRINNYA